ncbi:MAG: hypothetical protein H0U77_01700 [Nocardioidaceae bacterium]|nr:hypothetical protein [Nocardioidaceae bacterium]
MPMPPPKPSTETKPHRRRQREVDQITRALRTVGPTDRDGVNNAVGGDYWDPGRFDQALTAAVGSKQVTLDGDGRYAPA